MILLLFLGFLSVNINADDACYAPPNFDGPACNSSRGYIGVWYIDSIQYTIDVQGDTAVFCYGLGIGNCPAQTCEWKYWNLGLVNSGTNILTWGRNAGTPSIYCKGVPTGTTLRWDWKIAKCSPGCAPNIHNNIHNNHLNNVSTN